MTQRTTFLFPGQGAQYPGMGRDFRDSFAVAREVFAEADELLGMHLSKIIFEGPEDLLTETRYSQLGIYVASVALLRVVQHEFPNLIPTITAGLSLGEYTALTAAGYLPFGKGVQLVQYRGQYMNDACNATRGTMAVILGLDAETVIKVVDEVNLPRDLWAANFNCPGQVVISGTQKGIDAGTEAAKKHGAKRVLPLPVHGAFHSGLMQQAEERLSRHIEEIELKPSKVPVVMNVSGTATNDHDLIRKQLIRQVTSPVLWEQGVRHIVEMGVDLFIEMGPGKTLSGFNKRIGTLVPTVSVEKVDDLKILEITLKEAS